METIDYELNKKWVRSARIRGLFDKIKETEKWYEVMDGATHIFSVGKEEDVVANFHNGIRLEVELTDSRIKQVREEIESFREKDEVAWVNDKNDDDKDRMV